jgi:hypothetical protein
MIVYYSLFRQAEFVLISSFIHELREGLLIKRKKLHRDHRGHSNIVLLCVSSPILIHLSYNNTKAPQFPALPAVAFFDHRSYSEGGSEGWKVINKKGPAIG